MGIPEELFVESCGRPGLVCPCPLRRSARGDAHASLMFVLSLGMSMMFPFSIFWVPCAFVFNHMHFVRVDCVAALRTDGLVQHSRRESPVPFLGPVSGPVLRTAGRDQRLWLDTFRGPLFGPVSGPSSGTTFQSHFWDRPSHFLLLAPLGCKMMVPVLPHKCLAGLR